MATACEKCGGKVVKAGTLHSGNSHYAVWKCEKCAFEKLECIGLGAGTRF